MAQVLICEEYIAKKERKMKIRIGIATVAMVATLAKMTGQEIGAAGKFIANQAQTSAIIREKPSSNISYNWVHKYQYGYAEVFLRIPEMGRFTVQMDDQEITNSSGMFRFFDLGSSSQLLSIYKRGMLIYRVRLNVQNNHRMILDFFSARGLFLLDEVPLDRTRVIYGEDWNDMWNNPYGVGRGQQQYPPVGYAEPVKAMPMSEREFEDFMKIYRSRMFDDGKLKILKTQRRSFSVEQIRQMMKGISFGDNKMAVAKMCYEFCYEKFKYYTLVDAFRFPSEQEDFTDFIEEMNQRM